MGNFTVELLAEAVEFMDSLDAKTRDKIYYNIRKAQSTNDTELFKKLNDNIWEFRTFYNGKAYRLFSFWDFSSGAGSKSCTYYSRKIYLIS